jgi:hypothetical protein
LRAILKIFKTQNIKSEQLVAQWRQGNVSKTKTKKEKKVFSWLDYPSIKINDGYAKLIEDHKNNTIQIQNYANEIESARITQTTTKIEKSKTPLPPKSPIPPKPPSPVKIKSNGETKKMLTPEPPPPEPEKVVVAEQPKEPNTKPESELVQTTTRPNSGVKPISRPSTSKKTFFPNQTTRIYSPVANLLTNNDNTDGNDISNIKRPPSSSQNENPDSYIKNETYPQFPLNSTLLNESNNNLDIKNGADGESMQSVESGSVSIKPTLSPDSEHDNELSNGSNEKIIDE